jgi:hypothetical protein
VTTACVAAMFDYDTKCAFFAVSTLSIKSLYLAIFFPSLAFVISYLRQEGLNKQYRKLTIRRHVLYVSLMVICQTTTTIDFLVLWQDWTLPLWASYALILYFTLSPIFYALIRMSEPMVFETVKSNFLGCFRENRTNIKSESVSSVSSIKDSDLL